MGCPVAVVHSAVVGRTAAYLASSAGIVCSVVIVAVDSVRSVGWGRLGPVGFVSCCCCLAVIVVGAVVAFVGSASWAAVVADSVSSAGWPVVVGLVVVLPVVVAAGRLS